MKMEPDTAPAPQRASQRLSRITEAALQRAVEECARALGYMVYHTHDSRRSERGFPDLCLARARDGRFIMAELKTDRGRVRPEQREWLAALAACGIETYLWRARDWVSGRIEATLREGRGDE